MQDLDELLVTTWGRELFSKKNINFLEVKSKFEPFIAKIKSKTIKIVTIAGTNGKGQTTLELRDLLANKGFNVAAWMSPHLECPSERFIYNLEQIEGDELRKLILETELPPDLSYYEGLFFLFCSWAIEKPLDYILLEVGLGGRLDTVNVFDAELVLLTSIARDHCEHLGSRLDQILTEKLGVMRGGRQLIHGLTSCYLSDKVVLEGKRLGAQITNASSLVPSFKNLPYQVRNYALAHIAYSFLTKNEFKFTSPPSEIIHYGRGDEVTLGKARFIFISAHNLDGTRALKDRIDQSELGQKIDQIVCSFSERSLDELIQMTRVISSIKSGLPQLILTSFEHQRASSLMKEIYFSLKKSRDEESKEIAYRENIFSVFKESFFESEKTILISGSYYFLGIVRKFLKS